MRKTTSSSRGFSLVELMIGIVLGLILVAGVVEVFLGLRQTYQVNQGLSTMQQSARMALDLLVRDFRMIGFRGCDSKQERFVNTVDFDGDGTGDPDFDDLFEVNISAFDATQNNWSPTLPSTGIWQGVDPELGSDVINFSVIRDAGLRAANTIAANDTTISVHSSENVAQNDVVLVNDCEKSSTFVVTNASNNSLSRGGASNTGETLTDNNASFAEDVSLFKIENTIYFVAKSELSNRAGDQPLALWRKVNNQEQQQLVVGVQSMQVLYGEDTDEDGAVNRYVTANAADMEKVLTIRFQIIADSIEKTGGNDPLTRTFSQTVMLRNRGIQNG